MGLFLSLGFWCFFSPLLSPNVGSICSSSPSCRRPSALAERGRGEAPPALPPLLPPVSTWVNGSHLSAVCLSVCLSVCLPNDSQCDSLPVCLMWKRTKEDGLLLLVTIFSSLVFYTLMVSPLLLSSPCLAPLLISRFLLSSPCLFSLLLVSPLLSSLVPSFPLLVSHPPLLILLSSPLHHYMCVLCGFSILDVQVDVFVSTSRFSRYTWKEKDRKKEEDCILFYLLSPLFLPLSLCPPPLPPPLSLSLVPSFSHRVYQLHPKQMCWNANTQRSSHETSWQTHTHTHAHTRTRTESAAPVLVQFALSLPPPCLSTTSLTSSMLLSLSSRLHSPAREHHRATGSANNRGGGAEKTRATHNFKRLAAHLPHLNLFYFISV